jgi:hypothetical protein
MIGFGDQSVVRRPIYSSTGAKLGYLVSGPDGEWWVSLKGRRIGRIKQFRVKKLPDIDTSASGTYICPSEIDQ